MTVLAAIAIMGLVILLMKSQRHGRRGRCRCRSRWSGYRSGNHWICGMCGGKQ